VVSRYAKICHVVYGYQVARTTEGSVLNRRFFRNVYMYFAENIIYYDFNIKRFKKSHKEKIRKTLNIGYPALEKFVKQKPIEDMKRSEFNVLWTPRWTEDKVNGGSNFINFKDKVLELPWESENIFLTFRPHPMTFQHFISVGRITQEEVDRYVECYRQSERMHYDNEASYEKTFWESDMLLTDVSSVIAEYFLTGKPVVYCETGSVPNRLLEEMMKVFYVVTTWEEAKEKVLALSKGEDPLKEERQKKIKELMGDDFEHISERFLEEIYKDYNA
jgi:CDP-glycerol glycerophosphotransferase (TagB/SpsB family)